jgi:pimeloyl-ACP methyl ester carboxylesterase
MGATVMAKSGGPRGYALLVLNGTAQTAKTFTALARSLLASDAGVSSLILLDYPGHGHSRPPVGLPFGVLTMDDYATALLASLEKLADLHLGPNALMGHSLGAEIIHLAQTRLLSNGENLRDAFGITAAIFLAPDIANPLPWAAIDAGVADPLASMFLRTDPALGEVFDLLTLPAGPATWVGLFYGDRALPPTIAPGAPTPAQAVTKGFIALDSAAMVQQLIGLPETPGGPRKPRPTIDAHIFARAHGTTASVVTLEQDGLYVFPDEHRALYEFITGDHTARLFFAFAGPHTVHNLHTLKPGIYNEVIKRTLAASHDDDEGH